MVPHGESELSPDEKKSGNRPNVGDIKSFGCQVYIIPPGRIRERMDNNVKRGIFTGYIATSSQMYYWYMYTKLVKTYKHGRFDEVMNDLEIPTPNTRKLWISLGMPIPEDQEEAPIVMIPTLDSQHTQFPIIHDVTFRFLCDHDTLCIILGSCPERERFYLKDVFSRTSCSKIKG